MAHQRTLIREGFVAMLIAANTAAGARVYDTRVDPLKDIPAISVYTLSDPVDEDASSSTEEAHELELEVACWVAHTEAVPVATAMDNIAGQVEAAVIADPGIGGAAANTRLLGTEMEISEESGRSTPLVGKIVLTFAVEYRSSLVAPDPVDDFRTVVATQKVQGGVDDTPPVVDQFTVQEPPP
jgi:hypothetical protein